MTTAVSPMLGRPVWYELMTSDPAAAESFYKNVVGWTSAPFEGSPDPYTVFKRSGQVQVAGLLKTPAGMFRATEGPNVHRDEAKIATTRYYDVVNFARRVTVPGLYSWGFNDETCPPTSMYAAYNVITAPKRLMLAYDTGHRTTQEQVDDVDDWLVGELTGRGKSSAGLRH